MGTYEKPCTGGSYGREEAPSKGRYRDHKARRQIRSDLQRPERATPVGRPRKRITAWGSTEIAATAALIEKLRSTDLAPELPGKITAAEEKQVRDWLGPDGEDVKGTRPAEYDNDKGPLLSEWVDEWKTRWINPELQESSRNVYFGHIRTYILPYLGKYHMNELSANVLLDKWWKPLGDLKKVKDGLLTDQPLLGDSVKSNIYKTLRLLITTCHHKHRTRVALTESLIKKPVPKRPESDRKVRVFDESTKKSVNTKQTHGAQVKDVSNCPLCALGKDANAVKIWKLDEMDADHVESWSKGGATSVDNCQMLCKTHNRAKGNK